MPIVTTGYIEGTRGTMAVDWESRVEIDRLRTQRTAKATAAIADAGYDAVLLLADPNIRYVTSVATSSVSGAGGFHYSMLTAGGEITHWDSADHASVQKETCPWLTDVRYAAPGIGIVPAAIGGGPGADMMRAAMVDEVVGALRDRGVRLVPTELRATEADGGGPPRAYLVQPLVPRERHLNVLLRQATPETGAALLDALVEQVAMVVRYQGGDNAGHTVVTGVSIRCGARGTALSGSERTRVTFRDLDDDEIARYVATGEGRASRLLRLAALLLVHGVLNDLALDVLVADPCRHLRAGHVQALADLRKPERAAVEERRLDRLRDEADLLAVDGERSAARRVSPALEPHAREPQHGRVPVTQDALAALEVALVE